MKIYLKAFLVASCITLVFVTFFRAEKWLLDHLNPTLFQMGCAVVAMVFLLSLWGSIGVLRAIEKQAMARDAAATEAPKEPASR